MTKKRLLTAFGGAFGLLPLLGFLAIGCASAPHANADSVRATLDGFMSELNALDVDRIASYFADDVTAFVPLAQAARVEGKPALVEIFRAYCETTRKTTPRTNIVPEKLTVDLNGSIAIVTFEFTSPASVARRTFVFRYRQGRWLISHFHASNFTLAK